MSNVPIASPPAWAACPKCATQAPCYEPARSKYFGCLNCRTFFHCDLTAPTSKARIIKGFRKAPLTGPSLPLGITGALGSYYCRVTGYQVRTEQSDRTAEWYEYQLRPAEPLLGDAPADAPLQLVEYQGHWLLVRRALRHPTVVGPQSVQDNEWTDSTTGNSYRMWHRYQPVIRDAQGEFDWNIIEDERLKVQELVCPPYLLTGEKSPDRQPDWYLAQYLEPDQVATAFGLNANTMPNRLGTGAAQPNPHDTAPFWRLFGVAALLLSLLAGWLAINRPSTSTTETFTVPDTPAAPSAAASLSTASPTIDSLGRAVVPTAGAAATPSAPAAASTGYSQMLVSKTIVLTHPAALDITFTAPNLTNHWLEITASLVNEETGRGYEVTRALEYYEGVDDGESWSEGNHSVGALISSLPPGRYHLNLYPSPEAGMGDTTLVMELEQHADFFSNFLIILVLMSAVPLWHWMRHHSFESGRWENSDFAPSSS
ncbi:DUF4178 domain-containing protein [Hymenobacter sp. BT559]|uniref:DUF4178 domain-containing protein n=1 Tax=Hymenobacter sp. BT559 TaxID=2795729 RepID=UPI0018ED25FB|nr:DUF4178 domain-containing protein [Hymenobacter sp. BT559]MBJ6145170.1 DUF4178 domain-containing protein [Hymenobacter sp. BT559]